MMVALFRVLSWLPLRALHATGAFLGWVVYWASPTYRRRLRANLPASLPDRPALLREAVRESGRQMLEIPWVWLRPAQDLRARVHLLDPEGLAELLREARPVVMLTPHLGCFEAIAQRYMLSPSGAARPMLAVYRIPRKAALRPLMEGARLRHGLRLAPADLGGVRLMLRALRDGGIVGLLPDQVPSRGEGVWAPYFGRPAYSMTLTARLALALDALVLLL